MLTREQLIEISKLAKLNLGQQEKHYMQNLFLYSLYQTTSNDLIFKGGTCLSIVYNMDRFSEDLDFTSLVNEEKTLGIIKTAIKKLLFFGIESELKKEQSKKGLSLKLKYKGPLYDGRDVTLGSLRIEISLRKDIVLKPIKKMIITRYQDIPAYTIIAMNENEIFAEKIRAFLMREKARDLYDIWFLLNKEIVIDLNLIEKKLELYNKSFSTKLLKKKIELSERTWEKDLSLILSVVPNFKLVKNFVIKKINEPLKCFLGI